MKPLLAFCLLLSITTSALAEEPTDDPVAAIATRYFDALTQGDVAVADSLVGAPFSLDGRQVLTTLDAVAETHQIILDKKGKRDLPDRSVSRPETFTKLDPATFGDAYTVVRITLTDGESAGEAIDIYVKKSDDTYQVIGFKD